MFIAALIWLDEYLHICLLVDGTLAITGRCLVARMQKNLKNHLSWILVFTMHSLSPMHMTHVYIAVEVIGCSILTCSSLRERKTKFYERKFYDRRLQSLASTASGYAYTIANVTVAHLLPSQVRDHSGRTWKLSHPQFRSMCKFEQISNEWNWPV